MKVGIQFNNYDGMGSPAQHIYRFGYITIRERDGASGTLKCSSKGLPDIDIKFSIDKFEICDSIMTLKGTTERGRIDICFDVCGPCSKLATEFDEVRRLETMYKEMHSYFSKIYGDNIDFREIARFNLAKGDK